MMTNTELYRATRLPCDDPAPSALMHSSRVRACTHAITTRANTSLACKHEPCRLTIIFSLAVFFIVASIIPSRSAIATEVVLKDGRVLRGKLGEVSGLAEVPQPPNPDGEGPLQLILLLDDDLSRTFVPKRLVKAVQQEQGGQAEEKLLINQRTMRGGQIIRSVGPAVSILPFDEFGRRTFTMYTVRGNVPIIQGITELTPRWAKVEGISHTWDMRMATSAIPRDVLQKILLKQINPQDIESFKKIARFYLQAERYEDARQTLDDLIKAFPDRKELPEQLEPSLRAIKQLSAQQLSTELKLRREAGQHNLVWNACKSFPSDQVAGEILQTVRDTLQDYETKSARRTKVMQKFDVLLPKITDAYQHEQLQKIRDEIAAELSFNTIDRLAAFLQNVDDAQTSAQEKLALAISGWILGADAAIEQLPIALSMYNVRRQLREYLNEPAKLKRTQILDGLVSQEGSSPALIVDLLLHMKPAFDPPKQVSADRPGFFKLEVPGVSKDQPVTYWVQLPPEYDPYKLYPAVVTLNGAGNTAVSQIDWWAGDWAKPKATEEADKKDDNPKTFFARNGQATRHGYIVIAPEWTEERQNKYGYSAREHAAVLNSLRDACRRFFRRHRSCFSVRLFHGWRCRLGFGTRPSRPLGRRDSNLRVLRSLLQFLLGKRQVCAVLRSPRRTRRRKTHKKRPRPGPLSKTRFRCHGRRIRRPWP